MSTYYNLRQEESPLIFFSIPISNGWYFLFRFIYFSLNAVYIFHFFLDFRWFSIDEMCVNIVNIGLFLLFYSFNLAFSSEDFLHYYITHTSSEIFVDFIKDTMSAESARYCGLYCIQFTYCKSFNYHLKFHMCHLLVTDSRLLQQEDQLG